ncbi:MAG: Na/Pi cotransporter family protein, partial [Erysipelotrichaceae bacterium]|nr:Na/Pi cotransporter family protein [Erysipelotrichaceae bacterium]
EEIVKNEDVLDWYEDQLDTYLVKLSRIALSDEASDNVSKMLHVITDFERIGDHALNIAQLAKKYHERNSSFSQQAQREIAIMVSAVKEIIGFAIESFNENDLASAAQVEPLEEAIDALTDDMMNTHIERLRRGECTIELGFMLSELINNCERVSDHCSNIAVCVIEVSDDEYYSHQYLNDVKHESDAFKALYKYYLDKYSIKH